MREKCGRFALECVGIALQYTGFGKDTDAKTEFYGKFSPYIISKICNALKYLIWSLSELMVELPHVVCFSLKGMTLLWRCWVGCVAVPCFAAVA